MRKKILILFFSILLILILLSMSPREKTFYLNDEYYGHSSLIEIDSDALKTLEEDKRSFAVFVYQPYCTTSYDFNNHVTKFLDTYQMTFHKILFSNIKDTSIANYVKYCPSVVIYQNGQVVAYLDASSNKDMVYYESVKGLKKWFTTYVLLK